MTHVERLSPLPLMGEAEAESLWASIPTSASLPEADWDFDCD
jgi:hypothetical protein